MSRIGLWSQFLFTRRKDEFFTDLNMIHEMPILGTDEKGRAASSEFVDLAIKRFIAKWRVGEQSPSSLAASAIAAALVARPRVVARTTPSTRHLPPFVAHRSYRRDQGD